MRIETIHDLPDWDGNDGILALFILGDNSPLPNGCQFLNHADDVVQVGWMNHPKGYTIQPHTHGPRMSNRPPKEVLIITEGSMLVKIYNSKEALIVEKVVTRGDIVVLVDGGHGFEMLTDCQIVEVRDGPYLGIFDKRRF